MSLSSTANPAMAFDGVDTGQIYGIGRDFESGLETIDSLRDVRFDGGHGTAVTLLAAGGGARILGPGKDVRVLPVRIRGARRPIKGELALALTGYAAGLQAAASLDAAEVDVVNLSVGGSLLKFRSILIQQRVPLAERGPLMRRFEASVSDASRPALDLLTRKGIIFVAAAGNDGAPTDLSTPQSLAPRRGPPGSRKMDGNGLPIRYPLYLLAAGTSLEDLVKGPERAFDGSNLGPNISVAAPAENLIGLTPDGDFQVEDGTSFAAALVSGLAAELIFLDDAIRGRPTAGTRRDRRLAIVETIEATADDLGTTQVFGTGLLNNSPGNGPDRHFGHGRINAWKSALAIVNGGIAIEGRTDNQRPGRDDLFTSLRLLGADRTDWYGFKVRTSVLGATLWLDGEPLADPGAAAPGAPRAP